MLCPKCNQPVSDDARFCGHCGQPLSSAGPPDATFLRPPRGPVSEASALGTPPPNVPPPGAAPPPGSAGSAGWASGSSGSTQSLIDRVKNILVTPKTEWPIIEAEPTSITQLYKGYVVPLAAFSALMSFLRMSVIGVAFWRMPVLSGMVYAVVNFVFALIGLYLVSLIIDGLAPTFAAQRNRRQAIKTAAYAFTPGAVGAVFALLPGIGALLQLLAALYGVYLLYLGLPLLMRTSREKAVGYTAAVVVCTIILFVVLGLLMAVTGRITGYTPYANPSGYHSPYGYNSALPATAPETGNPSASGTAAAAAAMAALGGAIAGNRRVEPVDFHELKALLPESLPGMQRTHAEGESEGALGMKASSATASYQGSDGARAEIKIVDASAVSGLLGLADAAAANVSSESDTGYEKNATIGGRTVHEKYVIPSKHGELTAIVARRFTVDVQGDGVDMPTLERYAALVDFPRLEAMRDAGARPQ